MWLAVGEQPGPDRSTATDNRGQTTDAFRIPRIREKPEKPWSVPDYAAGRASLSLHSYTIDSLEHRAPMHDHVREDIEPFTAVRFRVDA